MSGPARDLPSLPEEGAGELQLELPAAHSAGRMARQLLREFALREAVPEPELETLQFVAGELLDNAVDHGGGNAAREEADLQSDVRMKMRLTLGEGCWTVSIEDQGGGEPELMRALIEPEDGFPDLEDERGRGFFLIAQMVDDLKVEKSTDGLGLAFIATKRFE